MSAAKGASSARNCRTACTLWDTLGVSTHQLLVGTVRLHDLQGAAFACDGQEVLEPEDHRRRMSARHCEEATAEHVALSRLC